MIYVSLSRVQRLEQLYILEELPENKMKPWMDAKEEMKELEEQDQSKPQDNQFSFKLSSMNIYSLRGHFEDLLEDMDFISSSVICLQESWTMPDDNEQDFALPGKILSLNSIRRGAGLATYYPEDFQKTYTATAWSFQITVVSSTDKAIVNLYRSSDANNASLISHLETVVTQNLEKSIYICGDWNLCHMEEENHQIFAFLYARQFNPIRNPKATHKKGRCIDMIWSRDSEAKETFTEKSKFVYYSDHAQQYFCLNADEKTETENDILEESTLQGS